MTTRLYLPFTINDNSTCAPYPLPPDECHYLLRVLRLKTGDAIHIYNEQAGEWKCTLTNVTKSSCNAQLEACIRKPEVEAITRLVYAPLKHDAMSFVFEKATELGVTHLQPITTDFAQKYNIQNEKVLRQLKQASQQCERLSLPIVYEPMPFAALIDSFNESDNVYIAMERSNAQSLSDAISKHDKQAPVTLIIGPEGGFSPLEKELILQKSHITCVSLGLNILRAETAAIVGLGAISMWR